MGIGNSKKEKELTIENFKYIDTLLDYIGKETYKNSISDHYDIYYWDEIKVSVKTHTGEIDQIVPSECVTAIENIYNKSKTIYEKNGTTII